MYKLNCYLIFHLIFLGSLEVSQSVSQSANQSGIMQRSIIAIVHLSIFSIPFLVVIPFCGRTRDDHAHLQYYYLPTYLGRSKQRSSNKWTAVMVFYDQLAVVVVGIMAQ